ncbi:MAG: GAF domain-containing protein [Polyangiaceae bacterium]|nr:GAF domain-containing protein [Polyangiaceae bacterium]MBK8938140.1 GAF domain-containing protein [Polyangiaceae bacterium]
MSTEPLERLTRRACELTEATMACCCVLAARPAFLFHGVRPSDRRTALARSLTEMVLQVARPRSLPRRRVVSRAPLFTAGRLLVIPVLEDGALVGAIGVAVQHPRAWTPTDLSKLQGLGRELSQLSFRRSGVMRSDRARGAGAGTGRRGPRLKTS